MERISIAIYIDLENINKNVDIKELMNDISLQYSKEESKPVFAVKIACGRTQAITNYRSQLAELNYEIRETPHIANKKNRADLIISLDAFEKFYIDQPDISLFVFLTNDSDYSVIMDLLRKYGKDVWLVTREEDAKRDIFQNSTDNILIITEYTLEDKAPLQQKLFGVTTEIDRRAVLTMLKVFNTLDPDKEYELGYLNNQFNKRDNSIKMKNTQFKSFKRLYKFLEDQSVIKIKKEKGGDKVTDIDTSKIKENL
ncbi:NYN domain-containing protein [Mycoplasmatota bacterium]|nr:NYN domain-containing protein [Mycoplasmatota bacterium]